MVSNPTQNHESHLVGTVMLATETKLQVTWYYHEINGGSFLFVIVPNENVVFKALYILNPLAVLLVIFLVIFCGTKFMVLQYCSIIEFFSTF